eukprot:6200316-Pleurochrysis_carterae.AAC.6
MFNSKSCGSAGATAAHTASEFSNVASVVSAPSIKGKFEMLWLVAKDASATCPCNGSHGTSSIANTIWSFPAPTFGSLRRDTHVLWHVQSFERLG